MTLATLFETILARVCGCQAEFRFLKEERAGGAWQEGYY
jgi:hypothetical protein